MKVKYPAEAFALGILLFSTGMKEAFTAGILVIASVVFAELFKNLLEEALPDWSWKLCVLIATASLTASAFRLGFSVLGIPVTTGLWIMTFVIGLLSAKAVLCNGFEAEYGDMLYASAILWGFWILFAIAREFLAGGSIFGNVLVESAPFFSTSFAQMGFGFLAAGMAIAFTNGILKMKCKNTQSLFLVIPAVIYARPFEMASFGEIVGIIWAIAVPIVLFISVKRMLKFSPAGAAYRGLPVEMLSMGLIYLILSVY